MVGRLFNAKFNQYIYSHPTKYIYKNIYLFTKNIFIQGNYIRSWKLYSIKEIYLFKEIIFIQGQGNMFIQGNYVVFPDI